MKKDLTNINLKTVPNGYALTVGDTECMYYNETDLLAGFMAHVGLGETANMEKGTILSTLFSAMMGQAYAESVTTLKQRVGLLTSQYNTTIERMDKAIEYVTQAEKSISLLLTRIDRIDNTLKATEQDHAQNKKVVDDAARKLSELETRCNGVMNSLANTATILKSMEEAAEVKKKADTEGGDQPSKSEKTDSNNKPARGGSRKKADALVVKEMEKQKNKK